MKKRWETTKGERELKEKKEKQWKREETKEGEWKQVLGHVTTMAVICIALFT